MVVWSQNTSAQEINLQDAALVFRKMVSSVEKFDAEFALIGGKQSESGGRLCFFPLNMFANLVPTLYGRETLR